MSDLMQRLELQAAAYSLLGEKDLPALLREAAAALRAAPEGFVLVPVEPTPEMLQAAAFAVSGRSGQKFKPMMSAGYTAMLAARPQGASDEQE